MLHPLTEKCSDILNSLDYFNISRELTYTLTYRYWIGIQV